VVDGRKYLSPGIIAEIEAYHISALTAHKEHRKPDVPLPTLA
jgi:hypothetical protein